MVTDSISAFASETWRKLAHRCLLRSPSLLLKHIDLVVERLLCAKPFGHYSIALNGKPSPLRRSAPEACISLYCRLISLILVKPFDHPRGPQCHARPFQHSQKPNPMTPVAYLRTFLGYRQSIRPNLPRPVCPASAVFSRHRRASSSKALSSSEIRRLAPRRCLWGKRLVLCNRLHLFLSYLKPTWLKYGE